MAGKYRRHVCAFFFFFAFQSEMFMAVVCFVCVGLTWILVIVFLW
jgi:hypothetical protein